MKHLLLISFLLSCSPCIAQEAVKPRTSPLTVVSTRYKDTYLKIVYSQPHKRGRDVFGSLVPYGQVWRTGANEATEITLTRDIKINSLDLRAGTYSVFVIPEKEKWTILFNSDLGLWGAYNYNSKMDILKFEVPVTTLTDVVYEPFTIWMDPKNDKSDLILAWDKTKVTIPIQFLEPTP